MDTPSQVIETASGSTTYHWAVRSGSQTNVFYDGDDPQFTLSGPASRLALIVEWTPTVPTNGDLQLSLGHEDGTILNSTAGSSPLELRVDGPIPDGEIYLLLSPSAETSPVFEQLVHWRVSVER